MKITSAEYIKSFVSIRSFDLKPLPSVAFIGRSNAGKSSLINALLNRKKLVKTSSTPGKTQTINHFMINNSFFFCDLPGYGFAKVPTKVKNSWLEMINQFLTECPNLRLVVQLVDIRHSPSQEDIDFQKRLQLFGRPSLVIANKSDKLKRSQKPKAIKRIRESMDLAEAPIPHSAVDKSGRAEIWQHVNRFLTA